MVTITFRRICFFFFFLSKCRKHPVCDAQRRGEINEPGLSRLHEYSNSTKSQRNGALFSRGKFSAPLGGECCCAGRAQSVKTGKVSTASKHKWESPRKIISLYESSVCLNDQVQNLKTHFRLLYNNHNFFKPVFFGKSMQPKNCICGQNHFAL